jgi:hypothetical protein
LAYKVYIFRHTLRADIRALGHKPSSDDQAQIQERRESLQTKIETFHQQALRYFRSDTASIIQSSSNNALEVIGIDLEDSNEEVFFLDAESEWEEDTEIHAEKARLWLPSSFTKSEQVQMGLGQVSEVEAELREGQANDALEALRAGLAEKSLRFRTEVKPAKGQKTMTRAWDSIHRADKQIRGAVWCYRLARSALGGLGVSAELLSRYQEIQKGDLKMSRDVVEENRVGQRSSELPWFWRLDTKWDKDRGTFLKECKCCCLTPAQLQSYCFAPVYRVNWLRAKARKERWEEEIELVTSEMDWTINCFQHHEGIWKGRAEEGKSPGHIAYAWKQSSVWGEWAKTAKGNFDILRDS